MITEATIISEAPNRHVAMVYLLVVLAILALVFYWSITRNNGYWKQKKVPYETPTFFFGNFKDAVVSGKHFGLLYRDLYRKSHNLPYFGYFKLQEPALMVNDPELIKNILIKDFAHFANNDFHVDPEVDKVFAANVFGQTGEQWKKNRSAWTYGMTTSKIKAMFESINEKCDLMVNYVKQHIKDTPNEPIEARLTASRFFTDCIVDCMLGIKVNSFKDQNNLYTKIATSLFTSTPMQGLITLMFIVAPWLGKLFKVRFVSKEMEDDLLSLSKKILEGRRTKGYEKNNPFDAIILHGDHDNSITELEVAGFLFGFLIDGTETSSGVSGYALYELAKNPDIQKRLRDELDQAAEANGGKLTYEDIHHLPYLDNVISETMRMYPPSMAIQRLCTKDYELPPIKQGDEPVKVNVGMPITIATFGMHMNPNFFPDPERFDPDRFNDQNKDSIQKMTYLPFGEGPRICLGTRLALNQVKIGLAAIIQNFEVRPSPETSVEKNMRIDPNIFVMRPVGGLWVKIYNRQ